MGTAAQAGGSPPPETARDRDKALAWRHAFPIIVSLIALGISTRQSFIANDAATITAYDRSVSPIIELDKAYLGNADLRPYFYDNKHLDSSDSAQTRVLALAEMTLDVFEIVMVQIEEHSDRFPATQQGGDRAWIAESFKNSEVLRDYLDSHQSWYGPTIKKIRVSVKP